MLRASLLPYRLPLEGGVIGVGLLRVFRGQEFIDDLQQHMQLLGGRYGFFSDLALQFVDVFGQTLEAFPSDQFNSLVECVSFGSVGHLFVAESLEMRNGLRLLRVQLRTLLLPDDLFLHMRMEMTERPPHLLMVRVRQGLGCEVAVAFEERSGFQKAVFSRSIVGAHSKRRCGWRCVRR